LYSNLWQKACGEPKSKRRGETGNISNPPNFSQKFRSASLAGTNHLPWATGLSTNSISAKCSVQTNATCKASEMFLSRSFGAFLLCSFRIRRMPNKAASILEFLFPIRRVREDADQPSNQPCPKTKLQCSSKNMLTYLTRGLFP